MGAGGARGEQLVPQTCFFSKRSKPRGYSPDRGFAKKMDKMQHQIPGRLDSRSKRIAAFDIREAGMKKWTLQHLLASQGCRM